MSQSMLQHLQAVDQTCHLERVRMTRAASGMLMMARWRAGKLSVHQSLLRVSV